MVGAPDEPSDRPGDCAEFERPPANWSSSIDEAGRPARVSATRPRVLRRSWRRHGPLPRPPRWREPSANSAGAPALARTEALVVSSTDGASPTSFCQRGRVSSGSVYPCARRNKPHATAPKTRAASIIGRRSDAAAFVAAAKRPIAATAENSSRQNCSLNRLLSIRRHPFSGTVPSRPWTAASSFALGRAVRVSTRRGQRALCASCWEVLPWIRRPIGP